MARVAAPVGEGLRLGMLVEITGHPTLGGRLGQLVKHSEADGKVEVCLTTGASLELKKENVRAPIDFKRPGLGGGLNSFDVLIGPCSQDDVIGEEIAACLFEKGFCVLRTCQAPDETASAVTVMRQKGDSGRLFRLPEEVEEGYLGFGAKGKVAWLDASNADAPKNPTLDKSDAFISKLAGLLQPASGDILGKHVDERTPALASLSLPDDEEAEYPPQDADDGTLGDFLRTWKRSLIKVVHFMGPGVSNVTLESTEENGAESLPCKQDSVEIAAEPSTILVFRSGAFRYGCHADGECLSLSANLLQHADNLVWGDWDGLDSAPWLLAGSGPPGPAGEQVNIVNMNTRLMCNWDEVDGYRAGLYGGGDGGVEIPILRWDVNMYYNPDDATRLPGQTYLKHQAFVEGLELFDNKYFEINANDAKVMDPMQRHVLEVGAQCLFKMGITKKTSNRTPHHAGCSVGLDKDDWDKSAAELYNCQGGTNVQAIISNRFSFIFNLKGPNYVADTACSASLAATHLAKYTLADREIDKIEFHVAIGIHQCFLPWGMEGYGPKMHWARCLTFNDSANGYMRGDGCSGVTLKWGDLPEERDAVWRASRVGQNGRSATMTAPNGIAQEEVITKAVKEAKISPIESCIWNCHGTGTSLGDPIEVGGVRRVQIKEQRQTPLLLLTNKTTTGHLEGGAAMTTIIAAALQVKAATATALCHFRRLNPNLEQSSFDMIITSECVASQFNQNNVHISSFGFGGTNGHAILWGCSKYDMADNQTLFLRKLQKMSPPEVRVNGADPSEWEWDGPDVSLKPGDKYTITLSPHDAPDAPIRFVKEEGDPVGDGEDDYYTIVGAFNDWEGDRMEDGLVTGLRTLTLDAPGGGTLDFRFLKNGEEDQVIYPATDKCTSRSAPVLGPVAEDMGREKNVWSVKAEAGQSVKIDLFICRGRRSVMWTIFQNEHFLPSE